MPPQPPTTAERVITVALVGNPNTGKSTLFSALVGVRQHVGNYPGVTVERKAGHMTLDGRQLEVLDLPGLYSLAPRSRDEMVACEVLLGDFKGLDHAQAVVFVANACNLERSLYLLSQVLELGLPVVLAVNMLDVAADHGIEVDLAALRRRLPIPVVGIQANRRLGLDELRAALAGELDLHAPERMTPFPEAFEREVAQLRSRFETAPVSGGEPPSSGLVRRLLLDAGGYLESDMMARGRLPTGTGNELALARARLAQDGCKVPGVETRARYAWVQEMLDGVVRHPEHDRPSFSDRVDSVLTHRVWGVLAFVMVMVVVFQAVFVGAQPLMDWIELGVEQVGQWVADAMPEGALQSLLQKGVIGGVGAIIVFLPQIAILFLFLAVLEDCGYIARAAYLADRTMARVGLSGKAFIPMLSCFACAVPGIMAARVIENERDRLTTILVAPLLTCSARLPVYALLIAAFIPSWTYLGGVLNLQGLVLAGLYALGIVVAVLAALVMKRTLLRGSTPPFLLELPSYKWPSPRNVAYRVTQRAWQFLRCAGTLIFAVSILVWAALYYPQHPPSVAPLRQARQSLLAEMEHLPPGTPRHDELAEEIAELGHEITGEQQRQSILGHLGRFIEPVVRPLGWDWRIGCAVLASLPAREVVVATMGVIYNLGDDLDHDSEDDLNRLQQKMRAATWDDSDRPVFTTPVALSILVFFALCAQCAATLAVMRQETGTWRWPAFAFTYMTLLAYIGAFITYQIGTWISAGG
ncbi:MAG: ferrous iron transport protein B [Thermoguttaceae bacterium]|jgi:ferrous iron transport protein B|nr:ferrous iron transport protein B [Thermoguttaceae bacterium]